MTKLIALTPDFHVAANVTAGDVPGLAGDGYAAVIAVAPDTDGVGESRDVREAAGRNGLAFSHIPVLAGLITDEQVAAFSQALDAAQGPVLAYCHSGLRAVLLWALARQDELGREHVVEAARNAGFEIAAYMDDDEEALLAA